MGFVLSEEQEAVVKDRDGQILVSAAAGSGKTRVLVERLLDRIDPPVEEGDSVSSSIPANITDFLVITFTEAAAEELKHRIATEVRQRILQGSGNVAHLRRQKGLMHQAHISTIHGFCSGLIRDYAHVLDLNPGFLQMDETEAKILQQEVLRDVMEVGYQKSVVWKKEQEQKQQQERASRYKKESVEEQAPYSSVESLPEEARFLRLVDSMGIGRDDAKLGKEVLSIYKKVQSHANPMAWLEEQKRIWVIDETTVLPLTEWGRALLSQWEETVLFVQDQLGKMKILCDKDFGTNEVWFRGYSTAVESDLKYIEDTFLPAIKCMKEEIAKQNETPFQGENRNPLVDLWDDILCVGQNMVFETMRLKPNIDKDDELLVEYQEHVKEIRDGVKKSLGSVGLREKNLVSHDDSLKEMAAVSPCVWALMDVVARFSKEYDAAKLERNKLDFGDLEHYAIELLLEKEKLGQSAIGKEVSQLFLEIMVDEYQDTNQVQNAIFNSVSCDGAGRNLFFVGDVKQAIYSFRLADPSIFTGHFQNFHKKTVINPAVPVGEPRSMVLSANYRSRREVLDACNDFFQDVMTLELGGSDYAQDGMLNPQASFPFPDGVKHNSKENPYHTEVALLDLSECDLKEADVEDGHEAEAQWVAKRVEALVAEQFPVAEGETLRPVRYSDIMILLRSHKSAQPYFEKAMKERCIPFQVDEERSIFTESEVKVAEGFLQIIDNPLQDIPLITVLRSPLLQFTPDELVMLRGGNPQEFFTALKYYTPEEGDDTQEQLGKKRDQFVAMLTSFRQAAWELTASELLWHVYEQYNVMGIYGAMEEGKEKQARLLGFHQIITRLEQGGNSSVFQCMAQLNALREMESLPKMKPQQKEENAVSFMSIHKSKGLEKPVVIVAGLSKQYNEMDNRDAVVFHEKMGVGPTGMEEREHFLYRKEQIDPNVQEYGVQNHKVKFDTLARTAVNYRKKKESIAEELRILYVAMTRAREKLILSVTLTKGVKTLKALSVYSHRPLLSTGLLQVNSLGKMLLMYLLSHESCEILRNMVLKEHKFPLAEGTKGIWDVQVVDCVKELGLPRKEDPSAVSGGTTTLLGTVGSGKAELDATEPEESNCSGIEDTTETVECALETTVETDKQRTSYLEALKEECAAFYEKSYPVEWRPAQHTPSKFTATKSKGRTVFRVFSDEELFDATALIAEEDVKFLEEETELLLREVEQEADPEIIVEQEQKTYQAKARTLDFGTGKQLDAAEKGIAIHRVMEYLHSGRLEEVLGGDCTEASVEKFMDWLEKTKRLSALQRKAVSAKKIVSFMESRWGQEARKSSRCEHEFRFSILVPATMFGFETEEELLLQGVVDCWYIDPNDENQIVIIDFKSDRATKKQLPQKSKEHENQMETYTIAMEQILGKKVRDRLLWFFTADEGVTVAPLEKKEGEN